MMRMLFCMRTTLNVDDDLYRQVKASAAASGQTVTSFVEEAMRLLLLRHQQAQSGQGEPFVIEPFRPPTGRGGVLPGVDLTNDAALEDLMDGL
jgi:hypothetical protein